MARTKSTARRVNYTDYSTDYTYIQKNYKDKNRIKYGCNGKCTGEDDNGGVVDKERKGTHDRVIKSVLTSIVLFRKIIEFARSNVSIEYGLKNIDYNLEPLYKKYKEIYSVDWMVRNGWHLLLKDKMERGESLLWSPRAIGGICALVRDPELFDYIYNKKRVLFSHHSILDAAVSKGNMMVYNQLEEQKDPISFIGPPITSENLVGKSIRFGQYQMFLKLIEEESSIKDRASSKMTKYTVDPSNDPLFLSELESIFTHLYYHIQNNPSLSLDNYIYHPFQTILRIQSLDLVEKFKLPFIRLDFISFMDGIVKSKVVTRKSLDFILGTLKIYTPANHYKEILQLLDKFSSEKYPLLSEQFKLTWDIYCIYHARSKKDGEYERRWESFMITSLREELERIKLASQQLVNNQNNNNNNNEEWDYNQYYKFIKYVAEIEGLLALFKFGNVDMVKCISNDGKQQVKIENHVLGNFQPNSVEMLKYIVQNRGSFSSVNELLTPSTLYHVLRNGWTEALDILYQELPSMFGETIHSYFYSWSIDFNMKSFETVSKLFEYMSAQSTTPVTPGNIFRSFTGDIEVVKKLLQMSSKLGYSTYTPESDDNLDALKFYCENLDTSLQHPTQWWSRRAGYNMGSNITSLVKKSLYKCTDYIINESRVSGSISSYNLQESLKIAFANKNTKMIQILLKRVKFCDHSCQIFPKTCTISEADFILNNSDPTSNVNLQEMLNSTTKSRRMDLFKHLWNNYQQKCMRFIDKNFLIDIGVHILQSNDLEFFKYYLHQFFEEYQSQSKLHPSLEEKNLDDSTRQQLKRKQSDNNEEDEDDQKDSENNQINNNNNYIENIENSGLINFKSCCQSIFNKVLAIGKVGHFNIECFTELINSNNGVEFFNKQMTAKVMQNTSVPLVHLLQSIDPKLITLPRSKQKTTPIIRYYITQQRQTKKAKIIQ